jgi:hypothetical protein
MGTVDVDESLGAGHYRIEVAQPGTYVSSTLLEADAVRIGLFVVGGERPPEFTVSKVLRNPDPTDNYLLTAVLPVSRNTTVALLAADLRFMPAAGVNVVAFDVVASEVGQVRDRIRALHEEQLGRTAAWWERPEGGRPPKAPWEP